MFNNIYDVNTGVLSNKQKLTADEIAKFLTNDPEAVYTEEIYNNARKEAKEHIEKFANIYNNKLYVALGMSIDSKDIEVGFTLQIGDTVEKFSIFLISISFIISLIILVIMATIMISENERNIAI
ncbi:UNVERIFIED_CONTAM: hypothetical protein O8I53_06520 [Campylobacter lari]